MPRRPHLPVSVALGDGPFERRRGRPGGAGRHAPGGGLRQARPPRHPADRRRRHAPRRPGRAPGGRRGGRRGLRRLGARGRAHPARAFPRWREAAGIQGCLIDTAVKDGRGLFALAGRRRPPRLRRRLPRAGPALGSGRVARARRSRARRDPRTRHRGRARGRLRGRPDPRARGRGARPGSRARAGRRHAGGGHGLAARRPCAQMLRAPTRLRVARRGIRPAGALLGEAPRSRRRWPVSSRRMRRAGFRPLTIQQCGRADPASARSSGRRRRQPPAGDAAEPRPAAPRREEAVHVLDEDEAPRLQHARDPGPDGVRGDVPRVRERVGAEEPGRRGEHVEPAGPRARAGPGRPPRPGASRARR